MNLLKIPAMSWYIKTKKIFINLHLCTLLSHSISLFMLIQIQPLNKACTLPLFPFLQLSVCATIFFPFLSQTFYTSHATFLYIVKAQSRDRDYQGPFILMARSRLPNLSAQTSLSSHYPYTSEGQRRSSFSVFLAASGFNLGFVEGAAPLLIGEAVSVCEAVSLIGFIRSHSLQFCDNGTEADNLADVFRVCSREHLMPWHRVRQNLCDKRRRIDTEA